MFLEIVFSMRRSRVAFTTPIFAPSRPEESRALLSFRVISEAPVTNVSCVKSTSSLRESVLVVEPHNMSILFIAQGLNRSSAVTGTYLTLYVRTNFVFNFCYDIFTDINRITGRIAVFVQKRHGWFRNTIPDLDLTGFFNLLKGSCEFLSCYRACEEND